MNDIQKTMLAGLKERQAKAKTIKKIDSASLYAGSPMYYYCRICGLLAATLPESHLCAAPKHCDPCKELLKQGYDNVLNKFPTT